MIRATLITSACFAVLITLAGTSAEAGGCGGFGGYRGGFRAPVYHNRVYRPKYVAPVRTVHVAPVQRTIITPVAPTCTTGLCAPIVFPKLGFLGAAGPDGMLIKKVMPGSVANLIGLEPGDLIATFDGRLIQNNHDWDCAMRDAYGQCDMKVIKFGCRDLTLMSIIVDQGNCYHVDHYRGAPLAKPATLLQSAAMLGR